MTHNGWRNPTPGLLQAEKFAQAGEQLAIPKNRATKAVKKVAACIGLKMPDIVLLDTLCAFTQEQDWEEGQRPIVWASNSYLEERTGMTVRCIQRHVRRLCEVGVISMKDSPNGKRFGKRDEDGYIQVAYGFDLAPLAARTNEFETLEARNAEEREFVKSMKSKLTITRRIIRAKIEKAQENQLRGPWSDLSAEFDQLLDCLPQRNLAAEKLLQIVEMFKLFQERVEAAFAAAFDWPEYNDNVSGIQEVEINNDNVYFSSKMTPTDDSNNTHILTTNQPHLVSSNSLEKSSAENSEPEFESAEQVGDIDLDIRWSSHTTQRKSEIDIPTLMVACPHFAEMARDLGGGYVRDWNDLHRVAAMVRGISGISEEKKIAF